MAAVGREAALLSMGTPSTENTEQVQPFPDSMLRGVKLVHGMLADSGGHHYEGDNLPRHISPGQVRHFSKRESPAG